MKWPLLMVAFALAGCGGTNSQVDTEACQFVRHQGMCEATVTLDPRESESPDEATALIVRWAWLGETPDDVPDRTVVSHLPAKEARALADAIDELEKSRCVVEEAVAPPLCQGRAAIVAVEADP